MVLGRRRSEEEERTWPALKRRGTAERRVSTKEA